MAYVASFMPPRCSEELCPNAATYVVRNRHNETIRHFCTKHRKRAEALAETLTQDEQREASS